MLIILVDFFNPVPNVFDGLIWNLLPFSPHGSSGSLGAPPGMEEHICSLTGAMGAMERINNTPLPFAYVSHLRTCLVPRQGVVGLMGAIRQVPVR